VNCKNLNRLNHAVISRIPTVFAKLAPSPLGKDRHRLAPGSVTKCLFCAAITLQAALSMFSESGEPSDTGQQQNVRRANARKDGEVEAQTPNKMCTLVVR